MPWQTYEHHRKVSEEVKARQEFINNKESAIN
jgi:hypothetical protein